MHKKIPGSGSNTQWGHFKIQNDEYRINKADGNAKKQQCCQFRKAMGRKGGGPDAGRKKKGGGWKDKEGEILCLRCMWQLFKDPRLCKKYQRAKC